MGWFWSVLLGWGVEEVVFVWGWVVRWVGGEMEGGFCFWKKKKKGGVEIKGSWEKRKKWVLFDCKSIISSKNSYYYYYYYSFTNWATASLINPNSKSNPFGVPAKCPQGEGITFIIIVFIIIIIIYFILFYLFDCLIF